MVTEDVASRAQNYGFPGFTVDGMDLAQCYEATKEAINHARTQGPVLLEMQVERLMPHTSDDDHLRYRTQDELDGIHQRDPVAAFGADLLAMGIITQEMSESIKAEALQAINEATDAADAATPPDASTMWGSVYSE